ncbi:MAG: ABC transporter substrate-binding protein [Pseudonocardiaceae bacterium]|nr:ABC transporter substrate-binding protein [Pseudonocardiaceae bacterium]
MSRRLPLVVAVVLAASVSFLAACSSTAPDGAAAAANAQTRTFEHAYGTTENVPAHPERVVTIGLREVENAVALGVTPVGYLDWFGNGLNPWTAEASDGSDPVAINDADWNLQYEKILSLKPDLIYANDGMTREQYERLSEIAPTVGPIDAVGKAAAGDSFVAWDTALERTGTILGREDRAGRVVDRVANEIADVPSEHPEFAGKSAAMAWAPNADGTWLATSADPRFQLVRDIGLKPNAAVAKHDAAGAEGQVQVSLEELDQLEADVLFLYSYQQSERDAAMNYSTFTRLGVVKDEHVVWMPTDIADALSFGTAISIEHVLSKLPALIAEKLAR